MKSNLLFPTLTLFLILFILSSFTIAIPTTVNNARPETKHSTNDKDNKQEVEKVPESLDEESDDYDIDGNDEEDDNKPELRRRYYHYHGWRRPYYYRPYGGYRFGHHGYDGYGYDGYGYHGYRGYYGSPFFERPRF
ncbi:6282_t:CDS:2 [Funneliformis caledonium]|uniref:6282_t:CDS:1 n=1 Tax=Funneliformis caledonium TaxID=1117310 RepID=A0A9N9AEB0_9GLOM|nr:6282_t:CDS:2 [Funneliformis caledonium]